VRRSSEDVNIKKASVPTKPQVLLPSLSEINRKYEKNKNIDRPKKSVEDQRKERIDEEIEELRRSDDAEYTRAPLAKEKHPRAFDDLSPIERVPQTPNSSLPRGGVEVEERVREHKAEQAMMRNFARTASKKERGQIVERMIDELLLKEVNLPVVDALSVMPEFRQKLNRRLRNRGARETNARTFLMEALLIDDPEPYEKEFVDKTHFIRAEDIDADEIFEVLAVPENGLPVGAVVHRDIVETFHQELTPEERRKVVIVASVSDGLRCIYPGVNKTDVEVESVLDGGSQIVAIDTMVARAVRLTWDPDTTIHMQSANGQLQKTRGLARNVPFVLGGLTVYLQLHVVDNAPFQILLGRPFDVLTESMVQNFPDGDQVLTITCPNTGTRCAIPTYRRGEHKSLKTQRGEPKLRLENAESSKREREEGTPQESTESVNFRRTSRN
jgi:CBS domain-containing protein